MNPPPRTLEELQDRLLNLEKQNRRLKQLGAAALIGVAVLVVMGQASSKKTIEANEFILKDSDGHVRARLSIRDPLLDIPRMELFDEKGRPSVELSGGFIPRDGSAGVQAGGMMLYDSQGHERGSLLASDTTAYLRISDVKGSLRTAVGEQAIIVEDGALIARSGKNISATIGGGIKVSDDQGFEATLGIADLVTPRTGESHRTSAASLVMFDKNKSVIWKAP